MARRFKRTYRADTTAMQGEGSYIEFTSPKVGDIRAIQSAGTGEDYEMGLDVLRKCIVDWNWCDEEGNPLPLPSESCDDLHQDEVGYLLKMLVTAKENDLKN